MTLKGQARGGMMAAIIAIFVLGLVGVALLTPLADEVEDVRNPKNATGDAVTSNITGAASSIANLLPLFYALVILVAFVAMVIFRRGGR